MIEKVGCSIQGMTPLLLHNPAGSMRVAGGASKGRSIPSPEEEAELATYRLEDGQLALPSIAVRNCIVAASGAYRHGRYNLRTFVSHIVVEPELLGLSDDAGTALKEYEIDVRRAVVQKQGIMRARPKLFPWSTSFEITYDPEVLAGEDAGELFVKLLADGGSRVGVGDYRPSSGGWFGRFSVAT